MTGKSILLHASIALLAVAASYYGFHAATEAPAAPMHPLDMHTLFTTWMAKHGKQYASPAEQTSRLSKFIANYRFIQESNKNAQNTFTLGLNRFADLDADEFRTKHMGAFPISNPANTMAPLKVQGSNPTSVDHRQTGGVNPVKDQGQCGSCWAFSTVASLEFMHWKKSGTLYSLSEQQLVDCSSDRQWGNHGCNGGNPILAYQYVEKQGIEQEGDYGYTAKDGTCKYDASKVVVYNTGYTQIQHNNGQALEDAVVDRVVTVLVDAQLWSFYQGGIYNSPMCGNRLDHGVAAVGYGVDSSSGEQYWIIRNSWGPDWGEQGYIRLLKNTSTRDHGMCGVNKQNSYPTEN